MLRKSNSRHSSNTSQDSQAEWPFRAHTSKRKPSALIRKMLNGDSKVSLREETSSTGQKMSAIAKQASFAIDSSDYYGIEEVEDDDVFPSVTPDYPHQFRSPKSATVGRSIKVATQNLLDLSGHLRPQVQADRHRQRQVESQLYSREFQVSKALMLRSSSDGIHDSMIVGNSEKIRRRGAMKRKSTLDLDHHNCSLRLLTEDGWSEVINCTSM